MQAKKNNEIDTIRITKNHKKSFLGIAFSLIIYAVLIISGVMLIYTNIQQINEKKELEQLAMIKENITSENIKPSEETNDPTVLDKYEALYQHNKDMIGWIKINGTNINYPVMFTKDNFYLNHNFDKKNSKSGIPYIDSRGSVDPFYTNTIIHGHNMKNETMFSELIKYKDIDFYKQHPVIQFDTLYEQQEYQIIAVFESEIFPKNNDKVFKYYQFLNSNNKDEYENYISNIKNLSLYEIEKTAEYNDQLITLSTCAYHTKNGRFVIVASKIK